MREYKEDILNTFGVLIRKTKREGLTSKNVVLL